MAFPTTPLNVVTELYLNGAWVNISTDVLLRDRISIVRGRSDEASRVDPSSCQLSIRNTNGTYSPRNPGSSYFGQLGRNTPLRVTIGRVPVAASAYDNTSPSATDHVAPSVTAATADAMLICAFASAQSPGNYTAPAGMTERAETDGTFATLSTATLALSSAGATGTKTATFSTAGSVTGWAAVSAVIYGSSGDPVLQETVSGDIQNNTLTLNTGSGTQAGWAMVAIQMWDWDPFDSAPSSPSGTGWTLLTDTTLATDNTPRIKVWLKFVETTGVQSVTFSKLSVGSTDDNHAHILVLSGVDFHSTRFVGEVPSWPSRWDVSGRDVWTPITASGILRRLGQGAAPLRSPIYREITSATNDQFMVAYWPGEDGSSATQIASASGGLAMSIAGDVSMADYDDIPGSDPLPTLSFGTTFTGQLPTYASGNTFIRSMWFVPSGGLTDGAYLLDIRTTGTAQRWVVRYGTGGSLNLQVLNLFTGALVDETGPFTIEVDGYRFLMNVELVQDGADVDVLLFTRKIQPDNTAPDSGSAVVEDTFTGLTVGYATKLIVGSGGNLDGCAVGHLAVGTDQSFAFGMEDAITGNIGETAGARITRLCQEENVPLHVVGSVSDTVAMGRQRTQTLLDLLRECETADGGVLHELRGELALAYRTRTDMYNQTASIALDYDAPGEVAPPLEPVEDDQHLRNDVTVKRQDGSSSRHVLESGPLSIQAPPNGAGRYDEEVTVNVASDAALPDQAAWRVHLGTWDESRYPTVHVDIAAAEKAGAGLMTPAASADIRDRLTIANPPAWLPPDDIDLLVEGYTEEIGLYDWDLQFNCSPGGPWVVGVLDSDTLGKLDTAGSELAAAIDDNDTAFDVATTDGPLWTTDDTEFPFDIAVGGERLTVTDVAASLVTFGATGTVAHANNANVTPGLPASTVAGNLLLALAAIRNSGTGTPNTPSGYTRLPVFEAASNVQLFGKIAGASESAPTISFSGGVANADTSAQMIRVAGKFHDIDTLVVNKASALNDSAQDVAYPGLAVDTDNCLIIYMGWKQDDWTSVGAISGATEIGEPNTTTGDDQGLVWDYVIQTTAANIPAGSFTVTGGVSAISRGAVAAIRCDKQTFTATRSVNGVVKSHSAGAAVSLWDPLVLAL